MNNPFFIGNICIKNRALLAPMAGITDVPFRLLARESGAGLVCSEMISAKGVYYSGFKTLSMIKIHPREHPVSVQIYGSNKKIMAIAARRIAEAGADIIDINFGCPMRKVTGTGAGMALLNDHGNCIDIMESIVSAVDVPVTVKLRTGFRIGQDLASELAVAAERCGVKALIIHARAASQYHKGPALWDMVADIVKRVNIPVIANGGINSGSVARRVMQTTGCAAVMIGQAVLGDFNIFQRINNFLEGGDNLPILDPGQKLQVFLRHLQLNCEYYGESIGIRRIRKLVPHYFRDLPEATRLRDTMMHLMALSEITEFVSGLLREIEE